MNIIKILCFIILIALGVFLIVYGEYDDSPGGQVIGLSVVIIGIVCLIKKKNKISELK